VRLLDLYCGAGGCAVGYARAGFDVVGVDIEPQPDYPFAFIQADALSLIGCGKFDAIHASPPCQAHTAMRTMWNAGEHRNLILETRSLLRATGLPYVIENVLGARAELDHPVEICGASVGLRSATHDLARHRLFETNWPLMVPPCAHGSRPVVGFYGDRVRDRRRIGGSSDRGKDIGISLADKRRLANEAMGIDWMQTWKGISQAVPPAYTEHIGYYLIIEIERRSESPSSEDDGQRSERSVCRHQWDLVWYGNWHKGEPRLRCRYCGRWQFELNDEDALNGRYVQFDGKPAEHDR